MKKIVINEFEGTNFYDVYAYVGDEWEAAQGLNYTDALQKIDEFITKYELAPTDKIVNQVFDINEYLVNTISETVAEYQGMVV